MIITFENEIKKEVKRELKRFKAENDIVVNYFFNDDGTGILKIEGYKSLSSDKSITLEYRFNHNSSGYSRIVLTNLMVIDAIFNAMLDTSYRLTPYFKNLKNIRLNGTDCDYWMDTIEIINIKGTKRVRHDGFSFHNNQMIYK